MTSSKTLLALFASLLPLSTVACGGSTGSADPAYSQDPAPSASSSSSSSSSQDDAGAPNPNGNPSTSDAGTTATSDAGTTTTTLAANCNVTLVEPSLCIENVSGHAGDIVDVPIDFIGSSSCTDAFEASGHLVLDANYFQLTNPVQQVDCISRDLYAAPAPGTTEVMWDAFGAGAISACPNDIVAGRLDKVKIEILPGTPAGDYQVTWLNANIAAPAACGTSGGGINGTIHVD